MVVFLSILSTLVMVNVVLLVFSVSGTKQKANTSVKGLSKKHIKKLISQEFSEAEYKKAV